MMKSDTIEIRYFGQLAELLETTSETLTLGSIANLSTLRAILSERNDRWQKAFNNSALLCAVNHSIVHDDMAIKGGDEIAFFPQVTGG